MSATDDTALRTPAWIMHGITGSEPAVLELARGRLALTTEEGRVFEATLADVSDVTFPWYYFGGGAKLTVGGREYRLSFVRPNGARDTSARLLQRLNFGGAVGVAVDAVALYEAGRKFHDAAVGRRAGKAWKAALAEAMSAGRSGGVS